MAIPCRCSFSASCAGFVMPGTQSWDRCPPGRLTRDFRPLSKRNDRKWQKSGLKCFDRCGRRGMGAGNCATAGNIRQFTARALLLRRVLYLHPLETAQIYRTAKARGAQTYTQWWRRAAFQLIVLSVAPPESEWVVACRLLTSRVALCERLFYVAWRVLTLI